MVDVKVFCKLYSIKIIVTKRVLKIHIYLTMLPLKKNMPTRDNDEETEWSSDLYVNM